MAKRCCERVQCPRTKRNVKVTVGGTSNARDTNTARSVRACSTPNAHRVPSYSIPNGNKTNKTSPRPVVVFALVPGDVPPFQRDSSYIPRPRLRHTHGVLQIFTTTSIRLSLASRTLTRTVRFRRGERKIITNKNNNNNRITTTWLETNAVDYFTRIYYFRFYFFWKILSK